MSLRRVIVVAIFALLVGVAAGYLYRRARHPTLEERAQDAAEELRSAAKKLTQ